MSSSPIVTLDDSCLEAFERLKKKTLKYIIFNLNDRLTEIVVEKKSSSTVYDDFVSDLPEDQCRWAVYDFNNKIIFVSW